MFAWTGEEALDRPSHDGPYAAASPKNADYMNHAHVDPPKKQVDAIAEAWGIHEPEPFEDFSAGGGERERATYPTINRDRERDRDREHKRPHEERPRNARRPSAIPPPAPIFGDEPLAQEETYGPPSSYTAPTSPNGGAGLGRNKSLMQRIRKMRDAPNVPVGAPGGPTASFDDSEVRGASLGGRPRERTKPVQYGRSQSQTRDPGPTSPDSFVYVDDPKMKELPVAPDMSPRSGHSEEGYFSATATAGGGVGRKGSIMRRMRGVVGRK